MTQARCGGTTVGARVKLPPTPAFMETPPMIRRLTFSLLLLAAWSAAAQDVVLRHALDGQALDTLATFAVRFNDEQKGKARVLLEDARNVADLHRLPHMALLEPEDGVQFFGTRPRFKPLHEVMREGGEKFDAARFYPQIADAVDDLTGKMQALPLGMALPALFINRDAFRRAKLDPDKPPRTWMEVQQAAGEIFDAGGKCPLTSSHFPWIHVENVSTQHGEPVAARAGKTEKLTVNSLVNVKHIAMLASWHKSFYFHWFGPARAAEEKFASGECAMLTAESSAYGALRGEAKFDLGVTELPHYDDVRGAKPNDVLPDGASLWFLPGAKKDASKVMARFVGFLLRPDNQKAWVRATSFLPMTPAAADALRASSPSPELLAQAEKRLATPRQGYRVGQVEGRSRVRDILNEEIVFVWQNVKPAKEALDTAVARSVSIFAPIGAAAAKTGGR
jgi:sn-glycerol 3-phosphate transport system substrate-binding protein